MARARRSGFATLAEARTLISDLLNDGLWHSSREIHQQLRHRLSEPMFGRVKKELSIEHRRVGGGQGSYYEWRLTP